MAENFTRIQRWDNGVLVEDYTVAKPTEQYNTEVLRERAVAALANNKDFIDTLNANITNAMAVAQIKALSRQNNGVIRLLLNLIDDIADTE